MNRISRIIFTIILVSSMVSGLGVAGCSGSASAQAPAVGKLAPDFKLTSLDGQVVSLSDFRGRPVFLNFWASWCGPCRFEMPFIQRMHEGLSDEELVVLAVNVGEDPTIVKEFVEDFGLTFLVLLDRNSDVRLKYNVRGYPTTFLIDKNGIIQDIKVGAFASEVEIAIRLKKIMP